MVSLEHACPMLIGQQNSSTVLRSISVQYAASLIQQTAMVDLFFYILVDLFVHSSGPFCTF